MTELELTWELPTAGLLGLAAAAVAVLLVLMLVTHVTTHTHCRRKFNASMRIISNVWTCLSNFL